MMVRTFHRGSSVFPCNVCGRKTRDTGVQSVGNKICPQCYELAGIENEISDGYHTFEERKDQIKEYMDEIAAKGGDITDWKQTFPE